MPESRQYELVYVVSPEVGEEGVTELHAQIETIVSDLGGTIEKTENWGRRRLAYEIDKHREGTYVVDLIEGPGELVKELDRKLKVLDSVLRHLVVRVDEDLRKADRARQRRQTRRQRRRGSSAAGVGRSACGARSSAATRGSQGVRDVWLWVSLRPMEPQTSRRCRNEC